MNTEEPNTDNTEEEDMREFARGLFTDEEDLTPAPEPDLNDGNRVPREGNNPQTPPGDPMVEFTRALFDRLD